MKRVGFVATLKPEISDKYLELHANTWPSVISQLGKSHLHNYSIFRKTLPNGERWLFSYEDLPPGEVWAPMQSIFHQS